MMQYIDFKGDRFSQLMLGTVQLGLNYGVANELGKPTIEMANDLLLASVQEGINVLDTARTYGNSEQVIGDFEKDHHSRSFHIITKFHIPSDLYIDSNACWTKALDSVRSSLQYLQVPSVAGCILHSGLEDSMDDVLTFLPNILSRLKLEGLIKFGGVSLYHPGDFPKLMQHPEIEWVQLPFNIFDQRAFRDIDSNEMLKNRMIVARSVFLQGLFFLSDDQLSGPFSIAGDLIRKLRKLSEKYQISIAEIAFKYVAEHPLIDAVVVGVDNVKQLRMNIELLNRPALPSDLTREIQENFSEVDPWIITPGLWPQKQT